MSPYNRVVPAPDPPLPGSSAMLDEVLTVVKMRRGIDFGHYRRTTLERRLTGRMVASGELDGTRFLQRLRDSDEELDRMVHAFTIKVSRFYRNAEVFDLLRERLIPDLVARFAPAGLRAWSAGCGRGEEAHTLAMLLHDGGGTVDATDIDGAALDFARAGRYPAEAFTELPPALERFVSRAPDAEPGAIAPELRRRVRFEWHDLGAASAGPGGRRYHLVCCRNVLIYFDPSLQLRVSRLLVESVLPGGLLCLGEAEWLAGYTALVEPVDRKRKVFRRR
jgi:chemotaxis methyl-accepting protein methylase